MTTSKIPTHFAYAVTENKGKDFWTRIGAVWPTKNGGFTIDLVALPINGRIVCALPRENVPPEPEPTV